jgi:hypothetical protein
VQAAAFVSRKKNVATPEAAGAVAVWFGFLLSVVRTLL